VRQLHNPGSGTPVVRVVASLLGTFHIALSLRVEVDHNNGTVGLKFVPFVENPAPAGLADIDVAPGSQVQPISPDSLHQYIQLADADLRREFTDKVLNGVTISPPFTIPGLDGVSLFLKQADIHTLAGDGGSVVVGMIFGDDPGTPDNLGDRANLELPFQLAEANVLARAHSALVDKALRAARESGSLQKAVDKGIADFQPGVSARITSTYAEVDTNVVKLRIGLFITGYCVQPISVTYAIDLTFSVIDGRIVVTRHDEVLGKAGAALLCLLTGLILAIASLGAAVIALVLPIVRVAAGGLPDDPPPFTVSALFESPKPVPGTEVRAAVEVLQAAAIDHELLSNGRLTLDTDTRNTFVYALFSDVSGLGARTPIAGAKVELMDLDNPAPPHDDAVPPPVSVTESGGTRTTKVLRSYVPGPNQRLLEPAFTREDGRVRFVLTPDDLRTTAGLAEFTVTRENLTTGAKFTTEERHTPVRESQPDMFFRITRTDGTTASTQSGSIANVGAGQHVGTADTPLRFEFGGPVVSDG
jgi:hypothetical protein